MELTGKVALVTGAGSGLGRAIALTFAGAGARLMLVDVNAEAATETLEAAGGRGEVAAVDVADAAAVTAAVAAAEEHLGPIDVAVNNAGIASPQRTPLHETATEDWERVLAVNLTGPFFVARAVLPSMVRRRSGVIVNVASAAGIVALPGRCHYATSKAGLIHLTRTLAVEYAAAGIRANALCPGYIDTPLVRAGLADPERAERLRTMIPMHRLADAGEIAGAALFLASDASRYMTGQALVVDGGWTAV